MIIVNLKGGLGNQMFQYALGRKLSIKNNDTLKLCTDSLDKAEVVGDTYRPFSLSQFSILKNLADQREVQQLRYPYGSLSKLSHIIRTKILRQTHVTFEPAILEQVGNIFLDGYWQSPLYFEDIRDTLLEELRPANPLSPYATKVINDMSNRVSVSIHIRRGDYIKNPRVQKEFGICSDRYYQKAVRYLTNTHPDATFFVFSDDIDWVKQNLDLNDRVTYVSGPELTETDELYMMSHCQHNIIANSSFSWWGAWLNKNPAKIVVAPTPWFDKEQYDAHLIPTSWIQLSKN